MSHSTPSTPSDDAKIADVLQKTRATLRRVELAIDNFPDTPDRERQVAAMHNVVMTGRTVTFVLRNMQHAAPNFHEWYKPWEDEMSQDPLLRYFKDLRNKIEKQGHEGVSNEMYITSLDLSRDLPPAPPNTIATIIGDENGGNGWDVRLEDGSVERIYFTLPEDKVRSWFSFVDLPDTHLGEPITEVTLENVCRLYKNYLERLVGSAEAEFGST